MNNTRRQLLLNAFMLFDLGLMLLAFMAGTLIIVHESRSMDFTSFFSMRVKIQNFAIFSILIIAWHLIFRVSGLYASRRLADRRGEVIDVTKATALGTLLLLAGATVFHITMVTPLFLLMFWLVSTSTAVSSRLALRVTLALLRRRGRNLRDIVIVGTNGRALEFARRLVSRPELGYRIIGFVDQDWYGGKGFRSTGYTLASDFDNFPRFLRNSVVDEVVVALPFRSMHEQASRIATLCEEQGVTVHVLSNVLNLQRARSSADEFEGNPLITHATGSAEGWPVILKIVFDFTISLTLVVLLCPLMAVVIVLIKFTSPGPVFFSQRRVGLNKRRFNLYKFRTMVVDAEKQMREIEHLNEASGPVFKIKNDPRITPLGRFLRKTSLDELPQLFNVLAGHMSLVGPRPLPVRDYEGFNEDWQRRRFSVKPGITCLWQVQGRSSISFEKWMELDLQYIDKWSLWLDFQILLQTIPAVLRGSGAV
jgi:exopolysaccharide biosynthesis polyprenyl glycosylphosphotransferase